MKLGQAGEQAVCEALQKNGWQILFTNYRCMAGEADIVAMDADSNEQTLVFIEVKTRTSARHGRPADSVTPRKQKRLINIALHYISEHPPGPEEPSIRFDIVEAFPLPGGSFRLNHLRNAFSPDSVRIT